MHQHIGELRLAFRHLLAAAGFAALLAGCSHDSGVSANALSPVRPTYARVEARNLLAAGYEHVHDRFIDPTDMGRLSVAGLHELDKMAPEVEFYDANQSLIVYANGQPVRTLRKPRGNGAHDWSRFTAEALEASWFASPTLQGTDPELAYKAIFNGLTAQLDGYSRYTDAYSTRLTRGSREGFGGIGIRIQHEGGHAVIRSVITGSPAALAHLAPDDRIIAIDGRSTIGLEPDEIIRRLRGPVSTRVVLGIDRPSESQPLDVAIVRSHVTPQTVEYERDGDIGYFRISNFNRRTVSDLDQKLREADGNPGAPLRGIILDLRNNPGGLLDQAVAVADLFVDDGLILSTHGRHPDSNSTFPATRRTAAHGLPIAVLINSRSASASEILAAALQDLGRAIVIGSTTHGKGSVQNVARMPNGGELIVTWSRMYAPSGYVLDRLGVLPTICTSEGRSIAMAPTPVSDTPSEEARAWHRYSVPDMVEAEILRESCPPDSATRESDLELAEGILRDIGRYRRAARPWISRMPSPTSG